MDFNNIKDDKYWCFGQGLKYGIGETDMLEIDNDVEQLKYYLAMMQFDCDDVTFNIRLLPYSPARWLFEAEDYEPTEEDFKAFTATEAFKKFAKEVVKKLRSAFASMRIIKKHYADESGLTRKQIDDILNSEMRYVTIAKGAYANPKMKAMPK